MKRAIRISAVLSVCCLMFLSVFAGCSAKNSIQEATDELKKIEVVAGDDSGSYGYSSEQQATVTAASKNSGSAVSPITPTSSGYLPNVTEKLIYNGSISVETKEFDKTVMAAKELAGKLGGYIESSNTSGDTYYATGSQLATIINRNANITYRVPQLKFNAFFTAAGSLGNVTSSSMNVQNVTAQFVDTEARLHTLKIEEERLLELLKKAAKIEDMITLESKLSDVRYQIESQTSSMRYLETQVDYSTISLSIREVSDYSDHVPVVRSFWQKLGDAFKQSGKDFVHGFQNIILTIVGNLPGLLFTAALIIFVILFAKKRILKKKIKLPSAEPDNKDQA